MIPLDPVIGVRNLFIARLPCAPRARSSLRRLFAAALLGAFLSLAAPRGAAIAHESAPIVVEVVGDGLGLSPAEIRGAVGAELGVPVLKPEEPAARNASRVLRITLLRAERQIIVAYRDVSGSETSEISILSDDAAANAQAIASSAASLERARRPSSPPTPPSTPAEPGRAAPSPAPQDVGVASNDDPADAPEPGEPPAVRPAGPPYFPVNISFLYPLAMNVGRPDIRTNVDLGILVSHVGAVEGLQVGLLNYTVYDVRGLQLSVAAITRGETTGVQIGATFAFADGTLVGAQLAGIFGWALNRSLQGVQLAGLASQSFGNVTGLQLSGGMSIARKEVRGAQISGFMNIGRVRGLQLGLINVSADVDGLQLGVINVARKIDGLQVGIVNITSSLTGESIGLANLLRPGTIHPSLWGSNSVSGNAGFRFSSEYVYSILSAAMDIQESAPVFGAGLTLGVHIPLRLPIPDLTISTDLGGYRFFPPSAALSGHNEVFKTRLIVRYELARRLSLFLGGGAFVSLKTEAKSTLHPRFGPEISGGLEL